MPDVKNWNGHSGEVLDSVQGFDVIECQKCGFKHIVPLPGEEEIAAFYSVAYYESEKPSMLKDYLDSLPWFNMIYDDRYDFFEGKLGGQGRVVDIGAGSGFFLLRGKERGDRKSVV